jgi:hypothetical protein
MKQSTVDILAYLYLLGTLIFRPRVEVLGGVGGCSGGAGPPLSTRVTLRRFVGF